jgi:tRNA (cmo5U34)-methyltransferase
MLNRARKLARKYGKRWEAHLSDLFEPSWLPKELGSFDAVVTSSCLHNLRDFGRIAEIYGEVRGRLKPCGVFLNLDLVNAPTSGLEQRYVTAAAARRQRAGTSGTDVAAMVRRGGRSSAEGVTGPFPANLEQHLAALAAAGFEDIDCFWKELRRALFGGYASPGG